MPRKNEDGDIEFTLDEFASFFGDDAYICPDCGTLHPTWEWAKRLNTCPTCKDRPSQEDVSGQRNETTPTDWKPKEAINAKE
jgi:hypothetical protein